MHALLTTRTTWSALMLAASTLALSAAPASAQEADADDAATSDLAAEGTVDPLLLDESVEGEAAAGTDVAADDTATEVEGDATVTAEGETEAAETEAEGTAVVEGQEVDENGVVITQGTEAQDGTELADDAAATAGESDATETAEGEAATEGMGTDVAVDTTMATEGTTETAAAETGMEATVTADAGAVANPPETPNADMQAVLDKLAELGAQPIETLSVEEARAQPTPADAVMAVMEERGIEMPADLAGILTRDITYPGADGTEIAARVYTPPEGEGPFPLIVYFHGGGWVIANIDVYDASARALAAGANAVVVSAAYRQAPETLFPAQHEDANAAYEWIVENSGEFNADSDRLAVAGESAGGNLAINVAIHARDAELTQPDHVLSVYPIANYEMTTPSYEAYAAAAPLSRAGMEWFVSHVFTDPSEAADPRVDLIEGADLQGLPPVTIINAEIDPLQSEGEMLAERLAAAGVEVEQMTYSGVAHEFFGMGAVVPEAQQAMDMAVANLRTAFSEGAGPGAAEQMGAAAEAGAETGAAGEVTEVEPTAAEVTDPMAADGTAEEGTVEMDGGTAEPMTGEEAPDAGN